MRNNILLDEYPEWINLDEQKELFYYVVYANRWQFGQVSDNNIEPNYPQWFQSFYDLKHNRHPDSTPEICKVLAARFQEQFAPPKEYTLVRCMASANTFGLDGDIHTDWPEQEQSVTAVLYTDKEWEPNWGGETIFYYNQFARAITYAPRKLVVFDSSIPHIGKGPQRRCKEMRSILAFQAVRTTTLNNKLNNNSDK